MINYGGDEVSALVVDIGSSSLRSGYAGDDTPKAIIPTSYGYHVIPGTALEVKGADAELKQGSTKMHIGQSGPSLWRPRMEVTNPMSDGLIHDFNSIPPLIEHALVEVMRCSPAEHPILVTEPAWNTPANRERMAEIMFEDFQVPAFYVANTGVLNAFAAGKGTALVIDVGKTMASVTPVVDGFVLRKGLAYSALPQLIHAHSRHFLVNSTATRQGIELWPHQLITGKTQVDLNSPPNYVLRQDRQAETTKSWLTWAENREIDEWIQSVAAVLEQGWNDQQASFRPSKPYEFPTGYNTYFGSERFQVGEEYFYHSPTTLQTNPNVPKHLPSLITDTLRSCDAELRQVLAGNVVLTGGGTLLAGFADRLSIELTRTFPHAKIHAPGNPIERRYGAWLGGSILASLGTFHQLWISKEEWQEHGKSIVGQRCK